VPMLANRGARVALLVQDALHPLVSAMPGVSRCFPGSTGAQLAFDMHCPMSSLPLAFKTRLDTIPAATSYLPAPEPERVQVWDDRLGARDRLRIGLVWSGSPTFSYSFIFGGTPLQSGASPPYPLSSADAGGNPFAHSASGPLSSSSRRPSSSVAPPTFPRNPCPVID